MLQRLAGVGVRWVRRLNGNHQGSLMVGNDGSYYFRGSYYYDSGLDENSKVVKIQGGSIKRKKTKTNKMPGLKVPTPSDSVGGDSYVPWEMGITSHLVMPMMDNIDKYDFQGKTIGDLLGPGRVSSKVTMI